MCVYIKYKYELIVLFIATKSSSIFCPMILFTGPEMLVRKASGLSGDGVDTYYDADGGDAVEAHEWRCVRTVNGTLHSNVFCGESFTFTNWLEFFFVLL